MGESCKLTLEGRGLSYLQSQIYAAVDCCDINGALRPWDANPAPGLQTNLIPFDNYGTYCFGNVTGLDRAGEISRLIWIVDGGTGVDMGLLTIQGPFATDF